VSIIGFASLSVHAFENFLFLTSKQCYFKAKFLGGDTVGFINSMMCLICKYAPLAQDCGRAFKIDRPAPQ
jgi:hypothetical protein